MNRCSENHIGALKEHIQRRLLANDRRRMVSFLQRCMLNNHRRMVLFKDGYYEYTVVEMIAFNDGVYEKLDFEC